MRTYYTKLLLTILSSLALSLAPQLVDAQCSADAGPNVTICQGESVTLGGNPTAVNANNPGNVTYNWDNGAADVANPVVSPNSTTTYEVELGGNGTGCNNEDDQITVTVLPAPNANFTASPQNQCASTPVTFTNTTTGCNNCTYSWNFGDPTSASNTSTLTSPTHTFNAYGNATETFTVTLTVTGQNGCQNVETLQVTVNEIPNIDLQDPITGFAQCSGDANFNVTVFDGTIPATNANYAINWGDGTPAWTGTTAPTGVSHNYTTIDVFDLVYSVTATNGCTASETIFVSNITNPSIGAANPGGTQGCGPLTICFPLNNYQANHESTTYTVDFGDGSPTQLLNHPPPTDICHTYTGSSCAAGGGAYTFTITANNNCDMSVATITPVRVYAAPVAAFTATPVPACVNSAITFNNVSTLGYNNQCSTTTLFTWSWGDGSPNTVVTTNSAQSHSYAVAGNYTVTLSAQNSCGTSTDSQVICVETPPTPIFTVNANTGCVPMAVTTDNTSNNGIPCAVNYTWLVDYIDLPCDPDNGLYSFTNSTSSSSLEPQFLLSSVGTYTLRLRMTNACGVFEDTEVITVNTVPVVAVNAISSVCSGTSVTPSAIVDACNLPITSYAWSFPNGSPTSSSTLSPGPVTYPTAGNYSISFTATNACGPSTATTPVAVLNPPVVALSSTNTNNHVCFNASTVLSATGAASYTWTPSGTLSSSIGSSVTAYPTTTTTYTVTGTSGSCTDTETITITVDPLPTVTPSGTFAMCAGETEVLGVNVTGGTAPYTQYLWNNGATLSSTTSPTPTSSATITTNYTVQVTDQNGCVGSGVVPLTVNPLPTVYAGPDIQLCNQPVPTNLTGYSPTTGGTGVWTGNNVTSAGVYTPNGVACDNLTYTFTSTATGCVNSDVVQVCVINPVAANGGPDFDICLNQPAVALPAGGTWTGTNVTANTFTPSTVGNTTLTFTVGSGSCQQSDQVIVTVNPLPTTNAGPDQTICAGVTVNLSGSGSSTNGAIQTTTWSSACGGITNSLTLTPTVTPATSCTYNLTVVDIEGCSSQDQVTITVNPLPVVAAGPDLSLCNQPIATTLTGFSPAGGVWTAVPGITLAGNQVTPQGNGSFVLTYTYTSPTTNCVNSDNITVNVNSPVNADAGPDLDICLNAPAYSIVPPVAGGGWGPVGTVTAGGTFTPTTVGSFTLTYTVGAGTCQTSDQMTIVVNPLPTVDAGPNVSICLTDTVQLSAIISSGTTPYSPISWNFPATLSNPNIANPLAHPSVTTNYTVNVTDAEGCQASDQVMVTVNSLPVVNAGPDLILCDQPIAETLTGFSPTVGGVGTWTGTGITNANGTFLSPGVGTYWLYYEFTAGGNACSNTDSIQVVVNAPVIANAGPDLTLCLNDAQVQFSGITPATGGTWSGTGVTNTSTGIFNPQIAGVGTYNISLQYGSGTCFTQDQVSVEVLPLPTVSAGNPVTICGNALPFNMAGYAPATGGTWEGTGITNATLGTFDPSVGAGTYPVFIWYTDPLTGCADSSYKNITVSPVPVANFSVPALGCTNAAVGIDNTSTGATTYTWNFGNTVVMNGFEPNYTYPAEGVFDIEMIAANAFGCQDTASNTNEIIAPPVANFTLLPADGCAPLSVDFNNQSVGQYVTYAWDLDISLSSLQTPTTQIYQQGPDVLVYPISLVVSNFCGSSTDNDNVTVYPQPVAGFGTNLDVFCSPFTVLFNNTSTGNPDQITWDFGDGSPNVTSEEPMSHVFFADTIPVDYTIYLYLANECGLDTANYTITVLPNTVTAFFNTNVTQGCSPLAVEFTDFSEGGNQLQYDFGDDTFTGSPNPTHIYTDPGFYTIYQYVDNGCSYDTTEITIEVFESPDIDFATDVPNICANDGVQFIPDPGNSVSITWDFGDGTTSDLSAPFHTYPSGGQYVVEMTGTSDNLCTTTVTHPFTVYSAPAADFTVPSQVGCSPFNVCFSNTSAGGLFYQWDFGDGNTDNDEDGCNTYTNISGTPELYTVRLIVENLQLCSDTVFMDVVVSPQPSSAFSLSAFESCTFPVTATTSNFSTFANGYNWFVNGDEVSDLTNTTLTFDAVGDYDVELTASNAYGCSSTSLAVYTVHPLPNLSLSASPIEGCVDLFVMFDNTSSGAVEYLWNFGDGGASDEYGPSHTYTTPGVYDVSLTAITDQGCSETLLMEDYVEVYNLPIASFIVNPHETTIYNPTIVFYDTSYDAIAWSWYFGDGYTSGEPYIAHTYEEGGTFPVTLSVWNEHGCTDSRADVVTVEDIFNIYVPNTFTPDDDGINEYFLPQMSGKAFIEKYLFQVIDRWGTVIFETTDPEEPWLGDTREGEYYSKDEAYNWQVIVQLKGSEEDRLYYGHVIMIR
jgi:PKD repeat protein